VSSVIGNVASTTSTVVQSYGSKYWCPAASPDQDETYWHLHVPFDIYSLLLILAKFLKRKQDGGRVGL
jgi:hypothetical protein